MPLTLATSSVRCSSFVRRSICASIIWRRLSGTSTSISSSGTPSFQLPFSREIKRRSVRWWSAATMNSGLPSECRCTSPAKPSGTLPPEDPAVRYAVTSASLSGSKAIS